jgi:hypothetical protein
MRRTVLFLILLSCIAPSLAEADEREDDRTIDWQTDLGGHVAINDRWSHRLFARWVLQPDERWTLGARYGLRWKPRAGFSVAATVGYEVEDVDREKRHRLVLSMGEDVRFWRGGESRVESDHLFGSGGYRHEGSYALGFWGVGVQASLRGDDVLLGPYFGSGHGLDPFRVEVRLSMGVHGDAPDSDMRVVLVWDME